MACRVPTVSVDSSHANSPELLLMLVTVAASAFPSPLRAAHRGPKGCPVRRTASACRRPPSPAHTCHRRWASWKWSSRGRHSGRTCCRTPQWGIVAELVRTHHLQVGLHGPDRHPTGDALHLIERVRAGLHKVVECPSAVFVPQASVEGLVSYKSIFVNWHDCD